MSPAEMARVLRAAADEADRIAAEHRAERRGWIDQATSLLGRRRHCAAVRRRMAAGAAGAAVVGRRCLLSSDAHDEELGSLGKRPPRPETGPERLRRRLGLPPETRTP